MLFLSSANTIRATAAAYDDMHVSGLDEHFLALSWLSSLIKLYKIGSLLDVGCGTGRCMRFLKAEELPITLVGVEPVEELRVIGRQRGLSDTNSSKATHWLCLLPIGPSILCVRSVSCIISRITKRPYRKCAGLLDAQCLFPIPTTLGRADQLREQLSKEFMQFRLWRAFDLVRTKGKGFHYSEGDGIYYSYSVFNDVPVLRRRFSDLHFMSTQPSAANLYRTAPHLAVFAQTAERTAFI